jgi:ABC-type bacteriocin/lantibiotic exporter with double-glycine peptidase domain
MTLAVPLFAQSQPHTCLPACVRMILAYHGQELSEAELAQAFKTIPLLGTQPDNVVSGLEVLGYHALWFENGTIDRLLELLSAKWPVIAFLRAQDLPHGRAGLHAIVIIGIENNHVIAHDPSMTDRLRLELNTFSQRWARLGRQGMVIWK